MKYCYSECFKGYLISLTIIFVLFLPLNLFSQWQNLGGIKTNILSVNSQSTKIEYVLTRYDENQINVNGTECVYYQIPNSIFLMERGMPQLPADRRSIIIPDLAATKFSIIDVEYETIETLPVMPSKGHFTRNIDPDSVPFEFDDFYTSNRWYPEENIILDVPYVVRDFRGQTIQFNPMQYNPAEGKLRVCKRVVIEVYSDPFEQAENPFYRMYPLDKVDKEFDDVYKTLFINYGLGELEYIPLNETGRLLIIYPTAFASNVTPFYNWKVERGITTLLAEYPTQTGTGSTAIKNYIQNLYNSPEGLTYIILVGESNQIPTMSGVYESAPSDPSYVKLAGNDAYPDAFISRISPSSAANLDYVLWKLIRYEKFPDTGPGAVWYLKGTGVASNEGSPPDWQRANWLRDMLINNMYFTIVDQIYEPSATTTQITNALNDGRSVLNYIGHGSGTSWGTTGFGNSHIYSLSNGYKNPFIIDVACTNGNFTMSECMEEAWIRAGDMSNPKGAIAAYGSSTLASWVPPCDMQNHATMLLTTRQKQTVGGVCFNGLMYAMDLWGGSTGEGLKLMEQYNIMGDCTTRLTFGMEQDTIPPTQITDLSAIDQTSNSIVLNWTSPIDSSFLGVVSYDLRYSVNPIITNNDFQNASQIIIAAGPDTAGMPKSYSVRGLQFSTSYYFAIKATDIWGNKSIMSNVVNQTTWGAPSIQINTVSLNCYMLQNSTHTDTVKIANVSSGNSTLDYQIELTNNTFPGDVFARIIQVNKENTFSDSKNSPDLNKGTSLRGSGGPDLFGYKWIDSNDPQGPSYEWNDIATTGTLVTNWVATSVYSALDEGKAGPFQLGFNFKYYGIDYNQLWFSSNGFISFVDISDAGMTNAQIPGSPIPNNIIAGIWDDLDGKTTGKVYFKQEPNKFIVQYDNWPGYFSGTGPFTWQFVLHKNGKIMIYYKTITGTSTSATVGIENHNGTDGLQVVYNASYLQNNLALQFSAEPEWLIAENLQGTIYNGNSIAVLLNFTTEGLEAGSYSMDMIITSNDPSSSSVTVPVNMEIVTAPSFQVSVNVTDGWNIVSIPGLHFENQNVNTWWQYRNQSAGVFKYDEGYQSVSELTPGVGYWMKHSGTRTYNTGDEWPPAGIQLVPHSPIPIHTGWNLISTYECLVNTSVLTTTPPNLQTGPVYGYQDGYSIANTVYPGYGYWLKSSGDGVLNIPDCNTYKSTAPLSEFLRDEWGKIIISDNSGRSFSLYTIETIDDNNIYELPPMPPAGSFDIRFATGKIAENLNVAQTIELSGVKYPVTVRVENINLRLYDETGKGVNVLLKSGEEAIITNETISKLVASKKILPDKYSLEQNYPNPFNPATTISFSLPEDVNNASLVIYNTLGERIAELLNSALHAGKYSYQWDAKNFASGIYIYELRTDKFVSVKKMLLMK